jgi:hypothetical protein
MNKTNLQKMQELSDSGCGVDWESLAFRAFALLTDKQIGKIAKAEEYFADEKNSDTLVIGMDLSTASQELKDYINKQLDENLQNERR